MELDIPCTEVFRAYSGQSSRLAYHLLTGAFVDDEYYRVYDPSLSWHRGEECFVHLGYRIRNTDAQAVARLAFDPVAHSNARRIVADTIAATAAGEPCSLTCFPPFHATTDLTARGLYRDDGTRFLVQELLECTAPFPAPTVRWGRPTSDRSSAAVIEVTRVDAPENGEHLEIETFDVGGPEIDVDLPARPIFRRQIVALETTSAATTAAATIERSADATGEVDASLGLEDHRDELSALNGRMALVELFDGTAFDGVLLVEEGARLSIATHDGHTIRVDFAYLRKLEPWFDPPDF